MLEKGDRFQYQSVVDNYRFRPEYPPAIYESLFALIDSTSLVLDIGCGPGKLSYPLAQHASRVDAVDLSAAMIEAAKRDPRDDSRINWIVGDTATVDLDVGYDLMVAGSSIHWMNLDSLFPILARLLSPRGKIAFVTGDLAVDHPWGADEIEIMKGVQLAINDERPAWVDTVRFPAAAPKAIVKYPLFTRAVMCAERHQVSCGVEDYINIFFSRQAFALDCMPVEVADRFRGDMNMLLAPFADDGRLSYMVESYLEYGTLSAT